MVLGCLDGILDRVVNRLMESRKKTVMRWAKVELWLRRRTGRRVRRRLRKVIVREYG